MIIPRRLTEHLRELGKYFPVLSLTGPRQAGKTTLLQYLFADYRYISFEDPEYRARFQEDARGFLAQYEDKVIFDEAQRVPDLFSYLQGLVDADRRPARFILSGSQNFLLMQNITQSLAGRVGIARLFPLDISEIKAAGLLPSDYLEVLHGGFYPIRYQIDMPPRFFYPNYLATYLERDVAEVINDSNLTTFRRFLQFCATLTGQTINMALICKSIGISVPTVKNWLSLLERSYVLFLLPPYFNNFGKRLVKSPKLYFYDTGLAAYLLELNSPDELAKSSFKGALFENMMVADRVKHRHHLGQQPDFYFFRDSNGLEADLLEESSQRVRLSEIKATSTYQPKMFEKLNSIAALFSQPAVKEVIYGGQDSFDVQDARVVSWKDAGAT
jgi:predicted AAA+ superfamily ATPase